MRSSRRRRGTTGDEQHDRAEFARFSATDYDAMQTFDDSVEKVGNDNSKEEMIKRSECEVKNDIYYFEQLTFCTLKTERSIVKEKIDSCRHVEAI